MYGQNPDRKHLEYVILHITNLATQKGRVAPPDVIARYLEQQLHANPEIVLNKIREMERRNLIELSKMTIAPREVGYDSCDAEKTLIEGYVTTGKGKGKIHLYDKINGNTFGNQIFPGFDTDICGA